MTVYRLVTTGGTQLYGPFPIDVFGNGSPTRDLDGFYARFDRRVNLDGTEQTVDQAWQTNVAALPTTAAVSKVEVEIHYRTSSSIFVPGPLHFGIQSDDVTLTTPSPAPLVFTTTTVDVTAGLGTAYTAAQLRTGATFTLSTVADAPTSSSQQSWEVDQVVVIVTAGSAALRQFPRDDAIGGQSRQFGSRSVQSSTRTGWSGTYR